VEALRKFRKNFISGQDFNPKSLDFGKQMNKETKLRIHNMTVKAALKFGSEGRNNV
jgi:hypothetical protein